MSRTPTFDERVSGTRASLRPAEQRVASYLRENREEVLVASAAQLASLINTSDATVIRTARALGFASLDALRRQLAAELRSSLSPASRLARTLGEIDDRPRSALDVTLGIHAKSLEHLRRDISPDQFQKAVDHLVQARRVFVFGIGPSSAIADYFVVQLSRFGLIGSTLKQTGLLLADGLQGLRAGDLLVVLAYSRVYAELVALLDRADQLRLRTILLTDTLGNVLRKRVDLVLPVERGKTNSLSLHTATVALIEALLIGIAAKRPAETVSSLKLLNDLRAQVAGRAMELPVSEEPQPGRRKKAMTSKKAS
jgi:DNA-binding MurR/RpiR family transcriptional regulator